jgi:hypothetical protein
LRRRGYPAAPVLERKGAVLEGKDGRVELERVLYPRSRLIDESRVFPSVLTRIDGIHFESWQHGMFALVGSTPAASPKKQTPWLTTTATTTLRGCYIDKTYDNASLLDFAELFVFLQHLSHKTMMLKLLSVCVPSLSLILSRRCVFTL